MEPPPSRYRRVELGWEGSAGRAQLAAASHPLPRARRRPSPGEWRRWGAPTRPASPPRRAFGGARPIQDGVTGSDLQGDGRTPCPSPAAAGASPQASRPGPRPRPGVCSSKAPRPQGLLRCGAHRPPGRARSPSSVALGPPALRGHRAPATSAPARRGLFARPPPFPEGHQFDFTGIRHRFPQHFWLILRVGSCRFSF